MNNSWVNKNSPLHCLKVCNTDWHFLIDSWMQKEVPECYSCGEIWPFIKAAITFFIKILKQQSFTDLYSNNKIQYTDTEREILANKSKSHQLYDRL